MFNTTNIYFNDAGQRGRPMVDVWAKVTAGSAVVTMLFTALLVVLTISALHRPTILVSPVTIPTPAVIQPPRERTIMSCPTQRTVSVASEPLGYPSLAWTLDTFYSR